MSQMRPINVLYAEDNPGDIRLTREALKDSKLTVNLHVVMDGVEAMEFLHKEGKFKDSPTPDLILLDLNMPRKDGRQVLMEIKEDPLLKKIPTAILTISKAEQDINHAYLLHANCYIIKPIDLDSFVGVVKSIEQFWFTIVTLPEANKG